MRATATAGAGIGPDAPRVRMLSLTYLDGAFTNAQQVNAREILVRLTPGRFRLTAFASGTVDPRLECRGDVRAVRLRRHGRALRMALEMMAPHDIIFYPHPGPAEMIYLRALRALGSQRHAPTIVHPIEIDLASLDGLPRDLCRRVERLIRHADIVVPITEHVARSLDQRFQRGGPIIPVGVDTRAFQPAPRSAREKLTVVTVGSLIERKQPRLALVLGRRFPGHRFLLVGDGPLRAQLEREAPANAEVRGPVPRDELPALLGGCDVLLHAGRLEGMPKAVLEGMASGLPPVLFGDYRPDWVKSGESGYVVRTENEMIEAIGRLLGDGALRQSLGVAARRVAECFDWDIVARMWEDLFLEVAARRRAGASMDFEQPRAVGPAESV